MSKKNKGKSWAWGGSRGDAVDAASSAGKYGDWYKGFQQERDLKEEQLQNALNGICQKVDRIVAGKQEITVRSAEGFGSTGATSLKEDRAEVFLDHKELDRWARFKDERIALTLEANMHELGHILHTPGFDLLKDAGATDADLPWFNILEDQRQELLLSRQFPKAADYFRHLNARAIRRTMLANNMGLPPIAFPLYWGRRHLFPADFMASLIQAVRKPQNQNYSVIMEAAGVVDEFLQLNLHTLASRKRGIELCRWLASAFGDPGQQIQVHQLTGRASCVPMHGKPEVVQQGVLASPEERLRQHQDSQAEASIAAERRGRGLESTSWDLLDEALEKLDGELDELAKELREPSLSWGKGFGGHQSIPLPEENVETAKRLSRQFADISHDLAMQEFRRQRRGKLDQRRLASGIAQEDNRLFRRRQKDLRPDAAMAVHVTIDSSGSMNALLEQAAAAAFTICKGAELAGHLARLTTFSDDWDELKGWNEHKYSASVPRGGGTQPCLLLSTVKKDFDNLRYGKEIHNHVLVMVTDGEWSDEAQARKILEDLRKEGVFVILIGLNYDLEQRNAYRGARKWPAYAVLNVKNVPELGTAMRTTLASIAKEIAGTILRKVGRS